MTILFNRTLLASFALAIAAMPAWAQSGAQSGTTVTNTVVAPAPVQEATHSRSVRHTAKIDASEGPQRIAGPVQSEGPSKSIGPVWTLGPYKSAGPTLGAGPLAAAGPLQGMND